MMRFEPRKVIDLLYSVRGFRSGQTVSVTVYDSNGNTALASSAMTELGSTGVYKKRFIPGKSDTYFAIADCTEYPQKDFQVLVVGGKPGDISLSGFIPKKTLDVWTEEEKRLVLKAISQFADDLKSLENYQSKIDSKISNLSEERKAMSLDIQDHLNDNFVNLNKNILDKNIVALENLSKKTEVLQVRTFEKLEKTSNDFMNKLNQLSRSSVVEKLEKFSELADDLNVTLSQLNLDPSRNKLNESIQKLVPYLDEVVILTKHSGGQVVRTIDGSS